MIGFDEKFDNSILKRELDLSGITYESVGRSWLGKKIYCIKLGTGEKNIAFLCSYNATETLCGQFLLRWAEEISISEKNDEKYLNYNIKNLLQKITIYIVPLPNPDGVELVKKGLNMQNPFYDRIKKITPEMDFSNWQSNMRGVDLCRNHDGEWINGKRLEKKLGTMTASKYGYGGEYPESEKESSSISYFIRRLEPDSVFYISLGDGEICSGTKNSDPHDSSKVAELIAKYSGLKYDPDKKDNFNSLKIWISDGLSIPFFEINLDKSQVNEPEKLYSVVRDWFIVSCAVAP